MEIVKTAHGFRDKEGGRYQQAKFLRCIKQGYTPLACRPIYTEIRQFTEIA